MAGIAKKTGEQAIENSTRLIKLSRSEGSLPIETKAVTARMKLLIDRVMCEAGFYAPDYAAIALKQSEGSLEEAVFLLRAYRSTLERHHVTLAMDTRSMRLTRRITSSFKDIPGGQVLGETYDYVHRLLDFSLPYEREEDLAAFRGQYENVAACGKTAVSAGRVSDLLREEGVIASYEPDDGEPDDVTANKLTFPASRSARLQTLFRADTGFLCGVAYSGIRGFGLPENPSIGELRRGYVEAVIPYPLDPDESMVLGEIPFTEMEGFIKNHRDTNGELDELELDIGYGLAFGGAEMRAIAMSVVDCGLNLPGQGCPLNDEEFVLMHGEALEMQGFLSHLKLPHYVSGQSRLDSIRKTREGEPAAEDAAKPAGEEKADGVR